MNPAGNGWLAKLGGGTEQARLVCFPYAGGGAHSYHGWRQAFAPSVGLHAVQLPGRGRRIVEKPVDRLEPVVEAVVVALRPFTDRPFVLFGHSMGAVLAFETARALRRERLPAPAHLFVSGYSAPHLPSEEEDVHQAPDERLVEKLREFDGTPPELLENAEMLNLTLPALRADLAVVETYRYRPEVPLDCPISAVCGSLDRYHPPERLDGWRLQTSGPFACHSFPGGHFFLNEFARQVTRLIALEIERLMRRVA